MEEEVYQEQDANQKMVQVLIFKEEQLNKVRINIIDQSTNKIYIDEFFDDQYFNSLEQRLIHHLFFIQEQDIQKQVYYAIKLDWQNFNLQNLFKKLEDVCLLKEIKLSKQDIDYLEVYKQIFQETQLLQIRSSQLIGNLETLVQSQEILQQIINNKYSLIIKEQSEHLIIDNKIIKQLSIYSNKGKSIWKIINQFCSSSLGEKILLKWIFQPSKNIKEIQFRQSQTVMYYKNQEFLRTIWMFLNKIPNLFKLIWKMDSSSKHTLNLKECFQLYQMHQYMTQIINQPHLINTEQERNIFNIFQDIFNELLPLRNIIEQSIDFNKIQSDKEICLNYNLCPNLQKLHEQQQLIQHQIEQLKRNIEKKYDVSLSLSYDFKDKIVMEGIKSDCYQFIQENVQFRTISFKKRSIIFTSQQLNLLSEQYYQIKKDMEQSIKELEQQIIQWVNQFQIVLEDACHFLGEQDVYIAFAQLLDFRKDQNQFCIPLFLNISQSGKIQVDKGWHPCLDQCIENDLFLQNDSQRVVILTGPNMGGKSTYLRMIGIITYLAHIGAPVPASSCELTVFDEIKTWVGSGDNLQESTSTFMNEMIEISNIVNSQCKNGIYLIDELGWGTSIKEGMALAFSIIEQLAQHPNKFVIFATHFFELTKLQEIHPQIKNYFMDCVRKENELVFTYKVKQGQVNKSFGIDIIQKLGFPQQIINEAKVILQKHDIEI